MRRTHLFLLLFLTGGCSTQGSHPIVLPRQEISVDLFSARGFLGGSDYERYHLTDAILWRECGNVERTAGTSRRETVDGDEVLKNDPALALQERRVEELAGDSVTQLKTRAYTLFQALSTADRSTLPQPGSVYSIAGDGAFELSIKVGNDEQRLLTSVDGIASGHQGILKSARDLFVALRSVGPVICTNRTFFGIERRAS